MEDNTLPFIPDHKIAWLSAAGALGFIFGCIILFIGPSPDFHEIVYAPKAIGLRAVNTSIAGYTHQMDSTQKLLDNLVIDKGDTVKTKQAALWKKKKESDSGIITKLTQYKELFEDSSHIDTTTFNLLNKALHFHITLEDLVLWDKDFAKRGFKWESPYVKGFLKDAAIPFTMEEDSISFKAVRASSNIAFITRYPITGVWIILVLIFCSFCPVAAVTTFFLKKKADDLLVVPPGKKNYLYTSIIVLLFIGLLFLICRLTFYDTGIVKDLYFMQGHTSFTTWFAIIGAVSGALCLAGFIYTSSMLETQAKPVIKAREEAATFKFAGKSETELLATQQKDAVKELDWKKLFGIFNTYFILASIILSLMVLNTGTLYSLINSLDFVRMLTNDWGYSPVRTDFLYLFGGLCTLVLLLVYIPARMRFAETDIPDLKTDGKFFEFLKTPFKNFTGMLAAASPLIVSIVQSLIDLLFKS
ncbi:hypothetical protein [Chitinophaga niabensis]|uniref:Uncharacterized protein n=1 Tax=Chitinophaga niabensis TaxID=536979 RepID=A0A1N6D6B6_9BACT|nr:hypothetical protein [Chitinophaga niabensis]SIN66247.1 hypothetical protein SAMN04488055_0333 [Chitinophaga niabensis]